MATSQEADAGSDPQPSLTRGFLFADLRDFTAYLEAQGAAATAELLERYRSLVRAEVERHRGAEVKTEGDSFYVVFSSVSAAVQCGLGILSAAAAANQERPDQPIRIGIGIHAGETVESGGGYVGSAVNIAARTCSQARPGELLVTDTVRALTKTVLPVTYASRGRRQLKGVAEPIQLFAASPTGATTTTSGRTPPRMAILGVSVAVLLVFGVAVVTTKMLGDAANGSPAANATPMSGLVPGSDIPPGTYRPRLAPAVELDVPSGWRLMTDQPDVFTIAVEVSDAADASGRLTIARLQTVYKGQCRADGTERIGDSADAVLDWLETHPSMTVTDGPFPVTVGTASAVEFELTVDELDPCPDDPVPAVGPRVYLFPTTGQPVIVGSASVFRVRVLEMAGTAVTILTEGGPFFPSRQLQPVLASVRPVD